MPLEHAIPQSAKSIRKTFLFRLPLHRSGGGSIRFISERATEQPAAQPFSPVGQDVTKRSLS
jgi:hypothetical protein